MCCAALGVTVVVTAAAAPVDRSLTPDTVSRAAARASAPSRPPRPEVRSRAGAARAAVDTGCKLVSNKRGDRFSICYAAWAELFPTGNLSYWTDCGDPFYATAGDLLASCTQLGEIYDAKAKTTSYTNGSGKLSSYYYDACGTQVGGGGPYNMGTPVDAGVLYSGTIFRVPPYEPVSCFGQWTVTFTIAVTFTDGQTITISFTGAFPVSVPGGFSGASETNGGGNPAELSCSQTCAGDPVNTATGNYAESSTDLSITGRGPGLLFGRTYNSLLAGRSSPLGFGWQMSYGMKLTGDVSTLATAEDITVTNENGSQTTFQWNPLTSSYAPPPRELATFVWNADGTFTYTVMARTIYTFNSSGQLTKIADLNGNTTTLAYNGAGQLTAATDGAGRSFTFGYNGSGQLTSVSDSTGRAVGYGYNASGDLTTVTDVRGHQWQYTYNNHLLLTVQDANGNTVMTNTYDTNGRVLTQQDALNRPTSFSYTTSGGTQVSRVTNPRGYVTEYDYTSGGLLSRETRALGTSFAASWTYAYDPYVFGVTSITDPNNHTSTATYDHQGNVLSTKSALNRTTSSTYDTLNDLKSHTDGNGTTTTYTYDTRGNLLTRSTPLLQANPVQYQTVTYTYGDSNHPGDVTAVKDADGNTSSYTYDAAGDLQSATDAAGDKTTYTYDSLGRRKTMVSPRGNANGADPTQFMTSYSYDDAGNQLSVTDPLSHQSTNTYDNDGHLLTFTDADGNQTAYVYNAASELTQVTRADSSFLKSSYDANGNLASQTDAAGKTTSYGYDPLDHQTTVTDPLTRTTSYARDAVGNLTSVTDPLHRTTSFTYNADNERTTTAYSGGATPNVGFGYDNDGQRTSMTDGTGSWTYTYDSLQRLTKVFTGRGDTVSFGYDLAGNQTSVTYPNGRTINRTFDTAERTQTIKDWLGDTTTYAYNPDSQIATVTFPASTSNVDAYTYNNADQNTGITIAQSSTTLASLIYGRDGKGQLQSETPLGLPGASQSYGYDKLSRLVNTGGYAYDAGDNPTTIAGVSGFSYDAANQLQSSALGSYIYNALGERTGYTPTSGTAANYSYDQAERLTSVSGTAAASYTYNGDGQRASKTTSGITRYFTWDESNTLPTLLSDGTTSYIYAPDGTPLEQIDSAGNATYYHHDQLGSTRLLTNASGNTVATFTYDAYGNPTGSTGTTTTPLRFAGEYADAETGLLYMRARYYDPATGQFLTRDPLESLTRHPYTYVGDNPLNAVDPSGLRGILGTGIGPDYSFGDLGHDIHSGLSALGNTAAGLADAATGGLSTKLLNATGITPNTCSAFFQAARPIGFMAVIFIPGLGEEELAAEGGVVFRYVTEGEAEIAERTGRVPNVDRLGNPKNVFYSTDRYNSAAEAERALQVGRYNPGATASPTHVIMASSRAANWSYGGNVEGGTGVEMATENSLDVLGIWRLGP